MTTPTPEAIEAACIAYVGLPGIDAEREWSRYSTHSQAAIRQQMSRALAAYESAMEAAGFVRVPAEPLKAIRAIAHAAWHAMDDSEELPNGSQVVSPEGMKEINDAFDLLDHGDIHCSTEWEATSPAMIAARPSANKGEPK